MVEFKDRPTAFACYQSPEYQGARAIRQRYADADFIIIDGATDWGAAADVGHINGKSW